jgi:hypothetical protein
MPLGISPSVRPIRLCSTPLTTCFGRQYPFAYFIRTPRQLAKSCSFIPVLHCEQNAVSDTYAGITPPFAPEYIGTASYVNKNLGFVRKAEQRGRIIREARPMNLETASGVENPLFPVTTQVLALEPQGWFPTSKSGAPARFRARDGQTQAVPAGASCSSTAANCTKARRLFFQTSFRSLRSELTPQTRRGQPRSFDWRERCTISCMKKKFHNELDVDVRCTHRLTLDLGKDPKLLNCHLSRPARSGR